MGRISFRSAFLASVLTASLIPSVFGQDDEAKRVVDQLTSYQKAIHGSLWDRAWAHRREPPRASRHRAAVIRRRANGKALPSC